MIVTDFAMDFVAEFLSCVFSGKDGLFDGFWDPVSLAKDGKKAKLIWGRKSTIKIHAELQVKHAADPPPEIFEFENPAE